MKVSLKQNWHWQLLLAFVIVMIALTAYWAAYLCTPYPNWGKGMQPPYEDLSLDARPIVARKRRESFVLVTIVILVVTALATALIGFIGRLARPRRWRRPVRQCLVLAYIVFFIWSIRSVWINPLPSDEAYIIQWQTHQADLERLVELYRNKTEVIAQAKIEKGSFYDVPEVKRLMARTGASHFHGEPHHGIGVDLGSVFPDQRRASLRYGFPAVLYKELIHRPVPLDVDTPSPQRVDSLNEYPPSLWPEGACFYRVLSPYWLLRVCRSYH
jgi:hypothetical protein